MEHNIDDLKRDYGMKSVDVAMPSHMHDDHMNGFPHLVRHHGTQVWCYENMVESSRIRAATTWAAFWASRSRWPDRSGTARRSDGRSSSSR